MYDKSFGLNPQKGKAKWSQDRLVYVSKNLSHVYWYQEKKKKNLICYSKACQNTNKPTNLPKNSKTHLIMMITINLSCKKISSLLISIIPDQEKLRYVTTMNLGLIPTEDGKRSCVLTSSFKVDKCGKWKLENEQHSGARYQSLSELMVNDSCHPSLCTNPRSTPNISTRMFHWNG